jgi:hypothetical protein
MRFPKRVELLYLPAQTSAEARVVRLTNPLIVRAMGEAWWIDPAIDPDKADAEIDRYWSWLDLEIKRGGRILRSRKLAIVTGDGAVQGAMMLSTEPVACELERSKEAIFVEMLFAAPRNRHWIRRDENEQLRGVGLQLLRTAAELSFEAGLKGRLKLESSPDFVDWYKKRGLLEVSADCILYQGVEYTPMELSADRVQFLLPELQKGS